MGNLKMVGGPRDGDIYKAPDGYREIDYFGEIKVPYVRDGVTGYAIYRRTKTITPQKTIRPLDEIHYVREG